MQGIFSFPHLMSSFPLLFTSAPTEAKPKVLEQWIYVHFSAACASALSTILELSAHALCPTTYIRHTPSSSGAKDTSTAHVSVAWM
ncbi:hypothetical protein BGW80DRAFT_1276909, partial [Lactifluus volemus]